MKFTKRFFSFFLAPTMLLTACAPTIPSLSKNEATRTPAKKIPKSDAAWEHRFDAITDENVRAALKKLYERYDGERLATWLASLYARESGGFYYAASARDYEGFLPDMESTYQIVQMMEHGMPAPNESFPAFLGEELTARMVTFYQGMQDEETGYFIHPQFGREETMRHVMRYSRDLDWSIAMLKKLGAAPLYPTPYDRLSGTSGGMTGNRASGANAEGWEANDASVRAYVHHLLDTTPSESWSNTLSTQAAMFDAAGVLGTVLDVLDKRIHPLLGLWVSSKNADGSYVNFIGQTESAYGIHTVTYKLLILYNRAGRRCPCALEMTENALDCILSRQSAIRVTYLFNPWATLHNLRANLKKSADAETLASFDAIMSEHAVALIDATLANLDDFYHADGSFSFLPEKSSPMLYGTTLSLGYKEGDVNGTMIGVFEMARCVCGALGYDTVPIFSEAHGQFLLDAMKNATKIKKAHPDATVRL